MYPFYCGFSVRDWLQSPGMKPPMEDKPSVRTGCCSVFGIWDIL